MPLWSIMTGLGFMLSTGGSAYVSNLFGQGRYDEGRAAFSLIMLGGVAFSLVMIVVGYLFTEPILKLLGADDVLLGYSEDYLVAFLPFATFFIIQFLSSQFLVVAGRPGVALALAVIGGITNISLDYILIGVMDMGITSAAVASGMSSMIPSAVALMFFCSKRSSVHFTVPCRRMSAFARTCGNGISEMVSELSNGITVLCYNLVMMDHLGADGVSAVAILSYVQFLALSVIIGYSNGIAPVMSFDHGAGDREEKRNVFRTSMVFVSLISVVVFALLELFSRGIAGIFASASDSVMDITADGAVIFSFGFIFMGVNLYVSSLFTSLSNGLISAIISALRSFVLLAPLIILLPMTFGIDAVWFAVPIAELATYAVSWFLILRYNGRYGYIGAAESTG
jgi:Na+-driven multidrug efflux pump